MKSPVDSSLLEQLEFEVAQHLQSGRVNRQAYERLKHKIDREVERGAEVLAKKHLWDQGFDIYDIGQRLRDNKHWRAVIGAVHVRYARDVLSLGRRLARVKSGEFRNHPLYQDAVAYCERHRAIAEQLRQLKGNVLSAAESQVQKMLENAVKAQDRNK